jgi:PPK2 family polyphosphate:nucleotide phosphotransferase
MPRKEILDRIRKYVHPFRITKGKGFRLKDFDPGETCGLKLDKGEAAELLQRGIAWLAEEQDMLYAQGRWSLLLVFQALDAAGKDGTIKHVMSGVNPQGCQVFSFKQPSSEELDHDFMWGYVRSLPERGRIGIFNRSYYEEVLVVRVHAEILKRQKLPLAVVGKEIWDERLADIAHFEDYATRQGTKILKFFLHVSRNEQKKRFMERLDEPEKNWKFSASDVQERKFWSDYMHAFEEAIRATASKHAPWFVVPADNKWFTRLVVAAAIVDAWKTSTSHTQRLTRRRRNNSRPHVWRSRASDRRSPVSTKRGMPLVFGTHSSQLCSGWIAALLAFEATVVSSNISPSSVSIGPMYANRSVGSYPKIVAMGALYAASPALAMCRA